MLVERAHLAVEHGVRRAQRLADRLRDAGEARRQVVLVAAEERDVPAGDVRERAVAVPLDLVQPVLALRHRLLERGEHRRVAARALRRLRLRLRLVALAEDQPVLLLAAELRRDERPHTVEPLAVQPNGQAAVLLALERARTCRCPRSRRCPRRSCPSGSRPRRSRSRAGGPRRARQGAAGRAPSARPSAPPSSRAHRRSPAGSRSAAATHRGAGRRRSAPCPCASSRTARASASGRACGGTRRAAARLDFARPRRSQSGQGPFLVEEFAPAVPRGRRGAASAGRPGSRSAVDARAAVSGGFVSRPGGKEPVGELLS